MPAVITPDQRCAWDLWEQSFGRLHEAGKIGTLVHESGQVFKFRVHSFEREGDEVVFRLEIIDEAQGSA